MTTARMKTIPLSPRLQDRRGEVERGFVAAVTGEICERLLELSEAQGEAKTHRMIMRLGTGERQPVLTCPRASVLWEQIKSLLSELCRAQGEGRTKTWLMRVACVARDPQCPRAVWHYLRIATGNLGALTESHAALGGKQTLRGLCRTKQAEHKEHRIAHTVINRYFPDLARVLNELKP